MDFSTWSLSDTILTVLIVLGFIGQVAILYYRTGLLDKRLDTQAEILERSEWRIKNRMDQLDKQIEVVDKRIDEIIQRLTGIESSMRQFNQNHIEHLSHHQSWN